MSTGIATGAGSDRTADSGSYAKAILNILEDAAAEKTHLADTQRAVLNVLEDAAVEKNQLEATQRAILNVLEDSAEEKAHLTDTQQAMQNILDDFDAEKNKVVRINQEMAREIAERKRAEVALEAANKELEAFAYSVSHDLRAPLRAIDGFSQALLEDYPDRLDEQGRHYLGRVRTGTQRMAELIDDMLQLSRLTSAKMRRETVDLSALAESVVAELREQQPERAVGIAIQPGLVAEGDAKLLRVLLTNLLGNAWKFTGKTDRARIEFGAAQENGKPVYFVRDNGAGFDMAHADKLFGTFQRLHTASEFPGSGIGLATVQRIVHRHGGRVWAEGAVNKGATFYFALPPTHET